MICICTLICAIVASPRRPTLNSTTGAFKVVSYKAMILEAVYNRRVKATCDLEEEEKQSREDIDTYMKKKYPYFYHRDPNRTPQAD
jgi:hypothetical protein